MILSDGERVKKVRKHEKDTGSTAVQIVGLTERIEKINLHLGTHPNDKGVRRGLMILVGARKRLIEYLKECSWHEYQNVIKLLHLRK